MDENLNLALQMFANMNDHDRSTYTDEGWYSGICNNCLNGEDPEIVGDELHALVMDWQDNVSRARDARRYF